MKRALAVAFAAVTATAGLGVAALPAQAPHQLTARPGTSVSTRMSATPVAATPGTATTPVGLTTSSALGEGSTTTTRRGSTTASPARASRPTSRCSKAKSGSDIWRSACALAQDSPRRRSPTTWAGHTSGPTAA